MLKKILAALCLLGSVCVAQSPSPQIIPTQSLSDARYVRQVTAGGQLLPGSNTAGTLQAVITAAGANSTIVVPSGYTETPTSGLAINNNNVTLLIMPGATITKGGNFDLVTVTGTNDQIYGGGTLAGNGTTYTGNVIMLNGAVNPQIHDLIITVPQNTGVALEGVSGGALHHLNISGMVAGDGIFGENNTSGVDVHDNVIDRTAATSFGHAIAFHSTTPGKIVSNNYIHANTIYNGYSFCVETGAFGGTPANGNSIDGNKCYQKVNAAGFGGYSVGSTAINFTVNDNLYVNTVGAPDLSGIEVVQAADATVKGNTIIGDNVSVNSSSSINVGGNVITNQYGNCIFAGNSGYSGYNVKNNTVDHNICDVSVSTNTTKGAIYFQCNLASIDCGENIIDKNTVIQNPGASGTFGITLENDYAGSGSTMANITISGNKISNATIGIDPDYTNAGTLPALLDNECISCTNLYAPTRLGNWSIVRDTTQYSKLGSLQISDQGSCTMASGACSAQTLSRTYRNAPNCFANWTGTGTLTGLIKVPSTTTTVTPASSVGSDSAQVAWACFGN